MNRSRGAVGAVLFCLLVLVAGCGSASTPTAQPPRTASVARPSGMPSPVPSTTAVGGPTAGAAPTSPTLAELEALRKRLAANPDDPAALRDLGLALLQRVRETADPSLYEQAEEALTRAQALDPKDPLVLVGKGGLQLGRHEFEEALATGRAALALRPSLRPAKAIEVDALVELGRYEEAVMAGQELLAMGTDLTTLSRLSYLREIHGNLPGALAAMEQAARSPALAPENTAFALTIAGNLQVLNGKPDEARRTYEQALALVPDHPPALTGLGRLAVGKGDLTDAVARFSRAAEVLPLPEYVIALGEAREAAGDAPGARESYDLARLETQLFQAGGVDVDLELALFEVDHGDVATGLTLAQEAYAKRRTFRTADALAWALHRSGRTGEADPLTKEALRLGTRDPLLLYHAGVIAAASGRADEARRLLTDALALDPGFSATGAAAARAELTRLGTGS